MVTRGTTCSVPLVVGVTGSQHEDAQVRETIRAAFERILSELRAEYPHTPLLVLSTENPESGDPALEAARAQQAGIAHESTLARVSHFSDILVVFADPASPAGHTETSVVARREHGRAAEQHRLLEPPEVATVYHVLLPGDGPIAPLDVRRVYPHRFEDDRRSAADFAAALARLDRFNADIAPIAVSPAQAALPSERLFTAVDAAANGLQAKLFFWQRALYALAFVAAAAQIMGSALGPWGSSIKVAAVVLTMAAYFVVRRSDYQNRYQDYRALSEGLRVQSAWTHAAVPDHVDTSYLRMQQTELLWIRSALRTVGFLQPDGGGGTHDATAVRSWVDDQLEYFHKASSKQNRRKEDFGLVVGVLAPLNLVLGLILLAGLALPPGWYGSGWLSIGPNRDLLRNAAGVFAGLAALIIAIVTSYMRTRAFSENANRYQRMFLIFGEAHRLLSASPAPDATAQRELARELGREALAEHAEWLLSQRERPVSVVYTSAA